MAVRIGLHRPAVLVAPPPPRRARLVAPRAGRSVVLLSRFARKVKGLVNQKVRQEPLPFKAEDDGKSSGSKSRLQLASAAALTGLAATAVTTAGATLAVAAPVLGHVVARTTTPLVGGYLRHFFRRRSELRDQATAGTFLLELPRLAEKSGGKMVLEGMLLQGPSNDAEHLTLLHFRSQETAMEFLEHEQLMALKKDVLDGLESMELLPKSAWRAYWDALLVRRSQTRRRFCKATAASLAQQLAVSGGGPVEVLHFVSAAAPQTARRGAAHTLQDVVRAGGRGKYFATVGEGEVELIVSYWSRAKKLMTYLRRAAIEWEEDEDDELMGETAVEQLLACPTL